MKKKLLLIFTLFCMLFLSVSSASAWYVELDNANGDNEIEVWFRVENGETVDLTKYDIGFNYDGTELEFASYTNNLPDGWSDKGLTPEEVSSNNGTITMYGIFGGGDSGTFNVSEDYLLGSYIMTVLDGAVTDGEMDVWFPAEDSNKDLEIAIKIGTMNTLEMYNTGNLIVDKKLINGSGLDIGAPVPVPAAVWLLGSGLMGLVGLRRKKYK